MDTPNQPKLAFERLQTGMYRVKDAGGYIGIVSGKPGKWLAETNSGEHLSSSTTRAESAKALSNHRQR